MIINCNQMMATDDMTECMFTVGSIVSCLTCFDARIEGEVIAFDYSKKLLVLSMSYVLNHFIYYCFFR